MHCLDCTLENHPNTPAVGCCRYCGAATCPEHATVVRPTTRPIGLIPAPPQRRVLSCRNCTPHLAVV